jgi:thiamine biosynthesis lipoprotein
VVVTDAGMLDRARRLLAGQLAELDLACSRFRSDSELSRANARAGQTVRIGPLLAAALRAGLGAAEASGGLVVPTLGAPLAAAGYDRTFRLVRRQGRLAFAIAPEPAAWRDVMLDSSRSELTIPQGIQLDLGATAKAFAADRAAGAIAAATGSAVLVSLGGDIAVAGEPPGPGWPVLIAQRHDASLDAPGPVVSIAGGGLATSSTRVRRWQSRRGELHHILDPRTNRPAETPWHTVSVTAATCLDANVAATGAIVAGALAAQWLTERRLPARLVDDDEVVTLVGGWPAELEAA